MERLMRRWNPDKGLKLIGDAAAEDSGAKYFLAMLKYRCNPTDLEAMALLQEISGDPSPPDGRWKNHNLWRLLLTVKIRQPSHEFTFGVGMSFIPYPLVLTPVV
jgi:hypothetical protein